MKRVLLSLFASFPVVIALCQDTAWKRQSITPDVVVLMPDSLIVSDTVQLKAITAVSDGYFFQLKYLKPNFEVKNGDELIQAYDGFLEGYIKASLASFENSVADTTIGGSMGEWVHSKYSHGDSFQEIYSYLVLVNSHFYMLSVAANQAVHTGDPRFIRFFSSLQFPVKPIKEQSHDFLLRAKGFRSGQHVGRGVREYAPWALSIAVLVLVAVFVLRGMRKKAERRNE